MLVSINKLRKHGSDTFRAFLEEEENKGFDGVALCDYRGYLARSYKETERIGLNHEYLSYLKEVLEKEYKEGKAIFDKFTQLNPTDTLKELDKRTYYSCSNELERVFTALITTRRAQGFNGIECNRVLTTKPVIKSQYGDINTGYPCLVRADGIQIWPMGMAVAFSNDCIDLKAVLKGKGIKLVGKTFMLSVFMFSE